MTDSVVLVSLKKQNDYLFVFGATILLVLFVLTGFGLLDADGPLQQEILIVLVFFSVWLIAAKFFFVHTIVCAKEGLFYFSNFRTVCVTWGKVGSAELIGDFTFHRHCYLLIRSNSGKIIKSIPSEKLQIESSQALNLIRSRL